MPIASGEMRHRLTLYAPEGTRGAGSPDELETGIPAKIEALPPQFQQRERIAAGGQRADTLYNITIRYNEDVREDLELHEECCMEREFRILNIVPDDKLQWQEITCVIAQTAEV